VKDFRRIHQRVSRRHFFTNHNRVYGDKRSFFSNAGSRL